MPTKRMAGNYGTSTIKEDTLYTSGFQFHYLTSTHCPISLINLNHVCILNCGHSIPFLFQQPHY